MFKIHTLQAAFGDSLILEFGTAAQKRWVLIDGGPEGTYGGSLRKELKEIADGGGALDRVILSHVDGDHIVGLLELFAELRQQTAPIAVAELWHNSFAKTIGDGTNVQARFQAMMASVAGANTIMSNSADEVNTIEDGNKLRLDALALTMPINTGFQNASGLARYLTRGADVGQPEGHDRRTDEGESRRPEGRNGSPGSTSMRMTPAAIRWWRRWPTRASRT